jgi:hypothetical protein
MSEPRYKKGDKVWTVNGEGGVIACVKWAHDNFRKRWYSVMLTVPNLALDSPSHLHQRLYYPEPELCERISLRSDARISQGSDAGLPRE